MGSVILAKKINIANHHKIQHITHTFKPKIRSRFMAAHYMSNIKNDRLKNNEKINMKN